MQQFWFTLAVGVLSAILSGLFLAHYKGLFEQVFQFTLRDDTQSRKWVFKGALALVGLGFSLGAGLTAGLQILDFKRDLAGVMKEHRKLFQENERLQADIRIYHQTFIEENPNKALAGNIKYTPRSRYCKEKGYASRDCLQKWSAERSALTWRETLAHFQPE